MDFFDAAADEAFLRTAEGTMAYCPWGKSGPKYVLPSPEIARAFHRSVKRMRFVFTLVLTFIGVFYMRQALWALAAVLLVQYLLVRFWTRNLTPTTAPTKDWPERKTDWITVPLGFLAIAFAFIAVRAVLQIATGIHEEFVPPPITLTLSLVLMIVLGAISRHRLRGMNGILLPMPSDPVATESATH